MAATIQKLIIYSAFGGSQNRLSVLSIWFALISIRALTLKFIVAKTISHFAPPEPRSSYQVPSGPASWLCWPSAASPPLVHQVGARILCDSLDDHANSVTTSLSSQNLFGSVGRGFTVLIADPEGCCAPPDRPRVLTPSYSKVSPTVAPYGRRSPPWPRIIGNTPSGSDRTRTCNVSVMSTAFYLWTTDPRFNWINARLATVGPTVDRSRPFGSPGEEGARRAKT